MLYKFFCIIRKIVFASVFIYSFDVLAVSLNFSIPINFFTVLLVSFFDIPAILCLVLFSVTF